MIPQASAGGDRPWPCWYRSFDLEQYGISGHRPHSLRQLPGFSSFPEIRWDWVRLLAGNAFGVAILGLLEAVAMAKAIAAQTGQKLNIHQQCLSEGMANQLAGSFFQCMPGSGSLTRSTVNQQAGAVSQWSGVFAAVAVAASMLLFAPLAGHIPRASLAGLLMLAAFRMVDRKQLVFHLRATRFDAGIVIATALAAVFVSVEFCILIGVFLSFVPVMARAAQVQFVQFTLGKRGGVREHRPDDPPDGPLLLFNLEGEISFGATPEIEKHLSRIEHAVGAEMPSSCCSSGGARSIPDAAFLGLLGEFYRRLQGRTRASSLILCGVRYDLAGAAACDGTGCRDRRGTYRPRDRFAGHEHGGRSPAGARHPGHCCRARE